MVHERFLCPVGQGGFSIEWINGYIIVYDCGSISSPQSIEKCMDRLKKKTDHIDVLFISHFDNDHVNSIQYLLNKVSVKKAVTPYIPAVLRTAYGVYTNGAYTSIMQLFKDRQVETDEIGDGEANSKPYLYKGLWEWIAKSMITLADFDNVTASLQDKGVVLEELDVNPKYLESQKEIINNTFKDVFGPKGPNSKGLIVLSQKCRDVKTKLGLIYQGCEWCHKTPSRMASFVSSCLYVGDADLKNMHNKSDVKGFLKSYRTEASLLLMQIPHHGSKYNVGARFETDFIAQYYFVNDINTKRLQNNQSLYNSLTGKKTLLVVGDNCQDMVVTQTEII